MMLDLRQCSDLRFFVVVNHRLALYRPQTARGCSQRTTINLTTTDLRFFRAR
jgi:hypothetical protein